MSNLKGIDLSKWNGKNVDFEKVRANGIQFVMLKAGSGSEIRQKDPCFDMNYEKAKKAGLKVGAYWYSYATCINDGEKEASVFYEVVKGKKFEMPLYYDIEEKGILNRGEAYVSAVSKKFCSYLEGKGYFAGIYASKNAMKFFSDDVRKKYTIWVAQWGARCTYDGQKGMWQYSNNGSVRGVNGRVDMDVSYVDFESAIRKKGLNGFNVTGGSEKGATMSDRDRVIEQAESWLGKKESDGSHRVIVDTYNAHKPLARNYKVKYTDSWCATFVSAVAIKCGLTGIIPTECGCEQMINKFKKIGSWVENDGYVPSKGDVIFYDWQDNGKGDDVGHSDHVGIVSGVSNGVIHVIEGNKNDAVARRDIAINGKYIRGFGVPKYKEEKKSTSSAVKTVESTVVKKKTVTDNVVKNVLAGKYGNGDERKRRLEAEGYDYTEVQKAVNNGVKNSKKTVTTAVVKDVINGKYGNGSARKTDVEKAGYDYSEVQKAVNNYLGKRN